MRDNCGRFYFAMDMNGDGAVTISDVWLIIQYLWLLPAKIVMLVIEGFPPLAAFLEITCETGTSFGGGVFSLLPWLVVFFLAMALLEA
jgi:hypothetical protein